MASSHPQQRHRWPLHRGYKIHKHFTPNPQQLQLGFIEVYPSDEGEIIGLFQNNQQPNTDAACHITLRRGGSRPDGYVPWRSEIITAGPEDTIYGEIKVNFAMPQILNIELNASELKYSDLYPRSLMALCLGVADKADVLNLSESDILNIKNPTFRHALVSRMVEGARSTGALRYLNESDFSLRDLAQNLRPVGDWCNEVPGVYLQILRKFKGQNNQNRQPEIRIGVTNNFLNREKQHIKEGRKGDGKFYQAMRLSEYTMYPLLSNVNDPTERRFAEQFTILQFGSYRATLLTERFVDQSTSDIESNHPSTIDRFGEVAINVMTARTMTAMAHETLPQSGWVAATLRPDTFGCKFGHNVTTPLFEMLPYDSLIWTRFDVPGVMAIFRRPPKQLASDGTFFRLDFKKGDGSIARMNLNLKFSAPGEPGPKTPGEKIYISIEIMLNGQPHPCQWARLWHVDFAVWSDWREAASVGIRVDWLDTTNNLWYKRYLVSGLPYDRWNDKDRGCLMRYSFASALRRHLMQEINPPKQESWRPAKPPNPSIKRITFDNLTQTCNVQDSFESRTAPEATIIPLSLVTARLQDLAGIQNVGLRWLPNGDSPPDAPMAKTLKKKRINCDLCKARPNGRRPCRLQPGKNNTCGNCWTLGLICSWSEPFDNLNLSMLTAVSIPHVASTWVRCDDPQYQIGGRT